MDALDQIMNAGGGQVRRNSRVTAVNNRSSVALDVAKIPKTTKNRSISMMDDIAEQIEKAEEANAKYDSNSSGGKS
jgi:hypothetical protein